MLSFLLSDADPPIWNVLSFLFIRSFSEKCLLSNLFLNIADCLSLRYRGVFLSLEALYAGWRWLALISQFCAQVACMELITDELRHV